MALFVLMVLLPATIFGVMIVRAVRSERVRVEYEKTQRQRHIVRLLEADLNDWLFGAHAESALSVSSLRFQLEGDKIVFPGFELSLPNTASPRRRPFDSAATADRPTLQSITDHYYPRVQAFLRDLNAGRNSGAQYFLRLRALVVRLPGADRGYVLDARPLQAHLNQRLAALCAAEQFGGELWIGGGPNDSPPGTHAFGLEGFPFFHVVFHDSAGAGLTGLHERAFPYSMAVLALFTILGSVFVHRAVSHEMRLSQLRSDFVAAVSHEFRSPLSSILALSERLEFVRLHDAEKLGQYHKIIGQDAGRLSSLVTRLLDFAQIEDGKKVYALERVELGAVAREAVETCRQLVGPERIQLVADETAPVWVRGDRAALRHSIQNLIENAGKYSPSDSPITVSCAGASGSASIEVLDRGVGIPLEEQEKIFEKFYRGNQASGLNAEGVGIGLALVKHVAESHGGSVSVDSRPGQGSRFRLRLPAL